ncbi:hypothetical protein CWS72_17355 [Telmatospirillum siberiense]|uniref:Uncharacterized protein n=2 Tax=Telmatospirillum siberiense TaxID=382514 RepID=A0A2N3PS12_9PROT|nr:hypothetical protein CWS72_17355 [Telmatospirillum siberiense]
MGWESRDKEGFDMALTMRGKLVNVLAVPDRKDEKTGEPIDGYSFCQMMSEEHVSTYGKRLQLHTFYVKSVEKCGAWVGREVEVPVRAYVDRKTGQQKFTVEDGAEVRLLVEPAKNQAA